MNKVVLSDYTARKIMQLRVGMGFIIALIGLIVLPLAMSFIPPNSPITVKAEEVAVVAIVLSFMSSISLWWKVPTILIFLFLLRWIRKEKDIWLAGKEGERKVEKRLSQRLGHKWTLLSGYKSHKNEIDHLLVGPPGVCALETKNHNCIVYIRGDDWEFEKYDRYGNVVENGKLLDGGGQSPSAQVNRAVASLEKHLSNIKLINRINRAVVLAHNKSEVKSIERPTVDCITTVRELNVHHLFPRQNKQLDSKETDRLVQAIKKSHKYHQGKSKNRKK